MAKRRKVNAKEQGMGLQGTTAEGLAKALDFFSNLAARTGYGTPSLTESTEYQMVRLSYDYWELITLYRNHWISRRIVDTPAQDMVRAWPSLTSDIVPKDIARIEKSLRRTATKNQMLRTMQWARLFGGAGALIVIDGHENILQEPLVLDDVELGSYKGLIPFDRWSGISPGTDICTDINRPLEFNKPESYLVSVSGGDSFKVHSSRILRFTGPSVPAPEYQAQTWWGISVIEPAYEEIRKRDNLSWNILSLSYRANILGMKIPDLAGLMSGLTSNQAQNARFQERMTQINHLMSNQSLVPLGADGGIEQTQYSFAGMSEVYQQFQLDISGATQIPVTRLWGRTITGLGQSNDADERIYEEKIASDQEEGMRPQLEQLYPVVCMSELGEVPDDLDLNFPSVRVLDEKEKSELAKTVVDTVTVALNSGLISPRTGGQELKQASAKTDLFTNLTDKDIAKLSEEVQSLDQMGEGLFGEEDGEPNLDPDASPQKVLKEEGKKKTGPKGKKGKAKDSIISLVVVPSETKVGLEIHSAGCNHVPASVLRRNKPFQADPKTALEEERAAQPGIPISLASCVRGKAKDSAERTSAMQLYHNLPVTVEHSVGEVREGRDWRVRMPADYGFIDGVEGADGDDLDCYIGPSPESSNAYVVDQKTLDGRLFDEHKVMLGYHTRESALEDYMAGHSSSKKVFGAITEMTMPMLRYWMATADLTQPCSAEFGP